MGDTTVNQRRSGTGDEAWRDRGSSDVGDGNAYSRRLSPTTPSRHRCPSGLIAIDGHEEDDRLGTARGTTVLFIGNEAVCGRPNLAGPMTPRLTGGARPHRPKPPVD